MSTLEGILYGFSVVLTYQNLLAAFAGALAGTAIGVLPGLGPTAGIAMILPISYSFEPATGLIMMAGMYYGAMYGGSTTAILVNMPGEAGSVMTCVDGYQMTKKGRGGPHLTTAAVGSFVGGTFATIGVMLFAPLLAKLTIELGLAEFFALDRGRAAAFLAHVGRPCLPPASSRWRSAFLLGTVGQEAVSGVYRFTFGVNELSLGIELIAVVVGVLRHRRDHDRGGITAQPGAARARPRCASSLPDTHRVEAPAAPYARGTILGFLIGLIPGPHTTLSSFVSYRLEKAVSKYRDELGHGAVEGVAGPETANNAAATATMVPLLALGLLVRRSHRGHARRHDGAGRAAGEGRFWCRRIRKIFWGLIASMYAGNVMLLILNVPMISLVGQHAAHPCLHLPAGDPAARDDRVAYSVSNCMLDIFVLIVRGIVGYEAPEMRFPARAAGHRPGARPANREESARGAYS